MTQPNKNKSIYNWNWLMIFKTVLYFSQKLQAITNNFYSSKHEAKICKIMILL